MPTVSRVFWRAITAADFFNIERNRGAAPTGGGGQSYISISFAGLSYSELGEFLGVSPSNRIGSDRPAVRLDAVAAVDDTALVAPLTFAARYRPPRTDDRYRITTQNRQFQQRHPAWTPARGFPSAPDDVFSSADGRLPDLTYLKVFVLRLDDDTYRAGFVNSAVAPQDLSDERLAVLFQPFQMHRSAGVIAFADGELQIDDWIVGARVAEGQGEVEGIPPEVEDAREATRVAAGKRPRGQGRRLDARQRYAIEMHAMKVTTEVLQAEGWSVDDVSAYRPYDLLCSRDDVEMRVEVKGTTGDGQVVLLTPGEVRHAQANEDSVALAIVARISLLIDEEDGTPVAEGGEYSFRHPWIIADDALVATGYEFRVPPLH